MLKISCLNLAYGEHKLFENFDLRLEAGQLCWVRGSNGSGKSSLLNAISGVTAHTGHAELSGKTELDGSELNCLPLFEKFRYLWHSQSDPEMQFFFPTCEAEIAFALENMGLSTNEIKQRIDKSLAAVGLDKIRHQSPKTLSFGQQKLLLFAIGEALNPLLFLLDEPLTGLSDSSVMLVISRLKELKQQGKTIIIAEHDPVIRSLADKEILLACETHIPDKVWQNKASFPLLPYISSSGKAHRDQMLFRLSGVIFGYDKSNPIFNNLSLCIHPDTNILLKGDNGSGKSTLLKLLIGLLTPSSGSVQIAGKTLNGLTAESFRHVVYQGQTISENLLGISPSQNWKLWKLSLPSLPNYPYQLDPIFADLSTGQAKQAGQSILPFVGDRFWLLDEPLANLDESAKNQFVDLLRTKAERNPGMLIVAHEDLASLLPFNQIWTLNSGDIHIKSGSGKFAYQRD